MPMSTPLAWHWPEAAQAPHISLTDETVTSMGRNWPTLWACEGCGVIMTARVETA